MTRNLNVYLYGRHIGRLSENSIGHLEFQYNDNGKAYRKY
jgi:hypothetical protein